ncbi:UvrD-helicase domain-containing protein [Rhizobium beringeri]
MKVLTSERAEFVEIADLAAEMVGRYDLRFEDYLRFGGIGLDASGAYIGSAPEDDMIALAAPHFMRLAAGRGFIDFASILYHSYCLLRDDREVSRSVATKFRSFLIDEFQDTTEIQVEILRLLHEEKRSKFFLVGDPAQSIFGFAGARPELIDPFADEIGAKRDLSLSWNFRSSPAVVEHAERLFSSQSGNDKRGQSEGLPRAGPPCFDGERLRCYNGRVPAGNRAHEVTIGPVNNPGKELECALSHFSCSSGLWDPCGWPGCKARWCTDRLAVVV